MACHNIMALIINHRSKKAVHVQEVLTKHGCCIKMRLGLHEAGDSCTEEGLVLLQVCGSEEEINTLESDLNSVEGVTAKTLTICS